MKNFGIAIRHGDLYPMADDEALEDIKIPNKLKYEAEQLIFKIRRITIMELNREGLTLDQYDQIVEWDESEEIEQMKIDEVLGK